MRLSYLASAVLLGSALSTAQAQLTTAAPTPTNPKAPAPVTKSVTFGDHTSTLPAPGIQFVSGSDAPCPAVAIGPGTAGSPHAGTTVGTTAGPTAGAPTCTSAANFTNDVWYDWTAAVTGQVQMSMCAAGGGSASFDTLLAVYNGTGCAPFAPQIACADDSCASQSQVTFCATSGNVYKVRLGGWAGSTGTYSLAITELPPPIQPPVDDCAIPGVAVTGANAFDNSTATNACEGQNNFKCQAFGSQNVTRDLWYTWTADCTGEVNVSTCTLTGVDTKIAIYAGTGCPSSAAIACDDDNCASLQSSINFMATSGSQYTIQLGCFPGALGGPGQFLITCLGTGDCDAIHDGGPETGVAVNGVNNDTLWMTRQGTVGGTTVVKAIKTAYGDLIAGSSSPNGTPARAGIWDDPNDDGNPSDLVLVAQVNTAVAQVDTGLLNTIVFSPSVSVSGVYFIGVSVQQPAAGQFNGPLSNAPAGTQDSLGRCYAAGQVAGLLNYAALGGASLPPTEVRSAGINGVWVMETDCKDPSISEFCAGDGVGNVCPCGNDSAVLGRGCDNSAFPAGAGLSGSGDAIVSADTLVLAGIDVRPGTLSMLFSSNNMAGGVVSVGDGLRCIGPSGVIRLFLFTPTNSTPTAGPGTIAARHAAKGDPLSGNPSRFYQIFYRDPVGGQGCVGPGDTTNYSNAVRVDWVD